MTVEAGRELEKIIFVQVDQTPILKLIDEIELFLDENGKAKIKTKADFELANIISQGCRRYLKDVEEARKELVAPFNEAKEPIQAAANAIKAKVEPFLNSVNQGMKAWSDAEKARIDKANEKLLIKSETTGKPVVLKEATTVPGFTMVDNWKAEVVDEQALIQAVKAGTVDPKYVTANETALNSLAKATSGKAVLPGIKFQNFPYRSGKIQ